VLLAQLTDLHLVAEGRLAYRVVDTGACLAAAVTRLRALGPRPDMVLLTGDLAYAGTDAEYARLAAMLAPLPMPWLAIPGNHDQRATMRAGLPARSCPAGAVAGRLCWSVDSGPLRVIGLDTLVEGEAHGELDGAQLAWLEARLSEARVRPTLVLLHHPPLPTGIAHMDRIALRDPAALGAVLARHPQVERVLCGHVHRPVHWRWAGTVVSVAPSTAHQVALDLRPDGPAAFTLEPPGFHLHRWIDGVGLVTHAVPVAAPAREYPFADG
jgi:Icc protein